MNTVSDLVAQATKWLGYKEGRNNATVFGKRTGFPNQPWCGSFVNCVAADAGVKLPGSMVYTPAGAEAFKNVKRFFTVPRKGDIVFFSFEGKRVDHVGIVVSTAGWKKGYIETIEGNTWSGTGQFQGNGDGVYKRVRNKKDIYGFGRPSFGGK